MKTQQSFTWVKDPAIQTQKAVGTLNKIYEATPPSPNGRGAVDQSKAKESPLTSKSVSRLLERKNIVNNGSGVSAVARSSKVQMGHNRSVKRIGREWMTDISTIIEF